MDLFMTEATLICGTNRTQLVVNGEHHHDPANVDDQV
jgi:hypothetical protein